MKSASMITLFSRPQLPPPRGSASFAISILAHVVGCVWLFWGLSHVPQIQNTSTLRHFTVRVLDSPLTAPQLQQYAASDTASSLPQPAGRSLPRAAASPQPAPSAAAPSPSPASMPVPAAQLPQLVHQAQTLIQPDAPPNVLLLHKTPIPTVFMWTPSPTPIKPVIQAPQQKSIVATLRPKLDPPNREVNLADVKMSSTPFPTALHSLPPSTTSPIVVRGPDPVKQMPQTATQPAPEPAPVRVMSLSDLQAQEGPIAIPLANASAAPTQSQALSSGHSANSTDSPHPTSAEAGHGTATDTGHTGSAVKQTGTGSGQNPGPPAQTSGTPSQKLGSAGQSTSAQNQKPDSSGQGSGVAPGKAPAGNGTVALITSPGSTPGPTPGSDAGAGSNDQTSVTRISLPKDGQFGVVVVGSALADKYPETADVWSGRMVYTVYLHVGAGKSWILQYSLPSTAQTASAGTRPDAPWPYDIVRPRFSPDDFTSDALMVHGFVNAAGHFERLALVFPTEFAKAKFLLSALQQWEFRPARQNGQVASVEVLLIIPEETE